MAEKNTSDSRNTRDAQNKHYVRTPDGILVVVTDGENKITDVYGIGGVEEKLAKHVTVCGKAEEYVDMYSPEMLVTAEKALEEVSLVLRGENTSSTESGATPHDNDSREENKDIGKNTGTARKRKRGRKKDKEKEARKKLKKEVMSYLREMWEEQAWTLRSKNAVYKSGMMVTTFLREASQIERQYILNSHYWYFLPVEFRYNYAIKSSNRRLLNANNSSVGKNRNSKILGTGFELVKILTDHHNIRKKISYVVTGTHDTILSNRIKEQTLEHDKKIALKITMERKIPYQLVTQILAKKQLQTHAKNLCLGNTTGGETTHMQGKKTTRADLWEANKHYWYEKYEDALNRMTKNLVSKKYYAKDRKRSYVVRTKRLQQAQFIIKGTKNTPIKNDKYPAKPLPRPGQPSEKTGDTNNTMEEHRETITDKEQEIWFAVTSTSMFSERNTTHIPIKELEEILLETQDVSVIDTLVVNPLSTANINTYQPVMKPLHEVIRNTEKYAEQITNTTIRSNTKKTTNPTNTSANKSVVKDPLIVPVYPVTVTVSVNTTYTPISILFYDAVLKTKHSSTFIPVTYQEVIAMFLTLRKIMGLSHDHKTAKTYAYFFLENGAQFITNALYNNVKPPLQTYPYMTLALTHLLSGYLVITGADGKKYVVRHVLNTNHKDILTHLEKKSKQTITYSRAEKGNNYPPQDQAHTTGYKQKTEHGTKEEPLQETNTRENTNNTSNTTTKNIITERKTTTTHNTSLTTEELKKIRAWKGIIAKNYEYAGKYSVTKNMERKKTKTKPRQYPVVITVLTEFINQNTAFKN